MTATPPEELLAGVRTLRLGARRDRRASAFPLSFFCAVIMAAPLCFVPLDVPMEIRGRYLDEGPFPAFLHLTPFAPVKYPGLVGWYWLLAIVAGFAATAWWYRRRAMRVGVESGSKAYLLAAGAALAGFLLAGPLLDELVPGTALRSRPELNVPILLGSAALSAVLSYWGTRNSRSDTGRAVGTAAAVVLAMVSFGAAGGYLRGFAALLVIAAGLLALAWTERNTLLAAIAGLFTAAALPANLYQVENVFHRLGWRPDQVQLLVAQRLLLPALVLLAGAVAITATERHPAR